MAAMHANEILALCQELHILDAGQVKRVHGELIEQSRSGPELLRLLVEWKYLTAFQVNEIHRGRGRDLLLDKYVLHSAISKGGMGEIYLAYHRELRRHVTLKLIKAEHLVNCDDAHHFIERFRREAAAIARLDHPKIVRVFDAGMSVNSTNRYYLAMEYLEGKDLRHILKENGPFSLIKVMDYVGQTAEGLQHLHERQLVHRDIKPANLLLTKENEIKILDLGIALIHTMNPDQQTESDLTHEVRGLGTMAYMAPEQQHNPHYVDIRADIYSLGRTGYSLLTGQVPPPCIHGEELISVLRREVPGFSENLASVFNRMLAQNPADRFQTPHQIVKALKSIAISDSTVTFFDQKNPAKWWRNHLVALTISITSIIAVLCLAINLLVHRSDPNRQSGIDDSSKETIQKEGKGTDNNSEVKNSTKKPIDLVKHNTGNPVAQPLGFYGKTRVLFGHTDKVLGVAFVGRQRRAISVSLMEALLWDLATDQPIKRRNRFQWSGFNSLDPKEMKSFIPGDLKDQMDRFRKQAEDSSFVHDSVAVTSDGKYAFFGGNSKSLLWDMEKWQKIELFTYPHNGTIGSCVGFYPDDSVSYYGSYDNIVRLYDVKKRNLKRSISGKVACVSSDGKQILTGMISRDGIYTAVTLQLYETKNYQRVKQIGEHRGGIGAVAMSPDSKVVMSAGLYDRDATIWDVESGKKSGQLVGHTKPIRSVAFSPDGTTLLTGSEDGTIRLWHAKTMREIGKNTEHTLPITSVAYSPDGKYVVSSSEDQSIAIWALPQK